MTIFMISHPLSCCVSLSFDHLPRLLPPPPPSSSSLQRISVDRQLLPPPTVAAAAALPSSFPNRRQVIGTMTLNSFLLRLAIGTTTTTSMSMIYPSPSQAVVNNEIETENRNIEKEFLSNPPIQHPFVYSPEWTGTNLSLQSWQDAVLHATASSTTTTTTTTTKPLKIWPMGRWPDPILRRPAEEVNAELLGFNDDDIDNQKKKKNENDTNYDDNDFNNNLIVLQQACEILQQTAQYYGAVGLAAQQCGINARIIYIRQGATGTTTITGGGSTWINPRIVGRSPESQMKIWKEQCLVLPSTWEGATVLRDAWIDVEYYDIIRSLSLSSLSSSLPTSLSLKKKRQRLYGESSRCFQHEYDHDRGILVTDHIDLDEMESDTMRKVERVGHEERQRIAYTRHFDTSLFM